MVAHGVLVGHDVPSRGREVAPEALGTRAGDEDAAGGGGAAAGAGRRGWRPGSPARGTPSSTSTWRRPTRPWAPRRSRRR